MAKSDEERTCFVIAPIGEEGTETRARADQILKHVITPVAKECGYTAVRADKISEPGIITSQVIQHLVEDPLVIADLTGRNANVFYELAVRHAVKKPVVQIIEIGESIPFDVAATRTIQIDHRDLDSAARCRDELARQIKAVEDDPSQVDSPISVAVDLQSLRRSENPLEKSNAEILSMLQEIRAAIGEVGNGSLRAPRISPAMLEDLVESSSRLEYILALGPDEEPSKERFAEASLVAHRNTRLLEMLALESGLPPAVVDRLRRAVLRRRPPRAVE
jgi:hypothetical protein